MRKKRIALGLARYSNLDRVLLDAYTQYNEIRGRDRFGSVGMSYEVDERIGEYELEASNVGGEVLLPLTQGQHGHLSYAFCILGHAFKTRGYEPVMPICDGDLSLCLRKEQRGHESREEAQERDHPSTCAMCNYYGRDMLSAFGIEPISIAPSKQSKDVMTMDRAALREFTYRDINVSKYARVTARRYLKKGRIDWTDSFEEDVYRRHLSSAVTLTDVAHDIFEVRDIDAVVAHHPVYTYGGVYLAVAEKYNVPAVTLGIGYNDGTIIFGNQHNRSPVPTFTDEGYLESVVETPLSSEEEEEIKSIMRDRASGKDLRVTIANEGNKTIAAPDDDLHIGLFTNLTWDAATEANNIVYEDTYDWVDDTLRRLGGRSDVSLTIKPHPAEALRGTKQGVADWLRDRKGDIPENVTLLDPDTEVDPYALIDDVDVGIVYASTIGLEMAYHGIPVVVVNDTHYRNLGFTFDPESVVEYTDMLKRAAELSMDREMVNRAKRYARFVFVDKQFPFPYYTQDNRDISLNPVRHPDVTPGNEPFDTIVEGVLSGGPVVQN